LQILGRYLRKETVKTFGAILMVLFVLTLGTLFAETLRMVARGALPASMLYIELGLRATDVLSILLPLSIYLAILTKLSQMYRNQEAVMMHSSGISMMQLLKMYRPYIIFFSGFMLLLSLIVVPWATRTSEKLTLAASKDVSLMGLKEGVFQELSGSNSVIYIRSINVEKNRLENIFVNVQHQDRVDTLTAEYGYQYEDPITKERYMTLYNGFRNEGVPGSKKYQLMRFEKNDIKLPRLEGKSVDANEKGKTWLQLLQSDLMEDKAEIHARLAPAFVVIVLMVIAVGISKSSPRDGKFGSLALGLLIYIVYLNSLSIARSLLEHENTPFWLGLWWVHLVFLIYGLWRIRSSDNVV
jgi:lipopolysaccharide export system permease protein